MTYKELCNRIDEELATDDFVVFFISDGTFNDLLSEAKNITTNKFCFTLKSDDESNMHLVIGSDNKSYPSWRLERLGDKYSHWDVFEKELKTDSSARGVLL